MHMLTLLHALKNRNLIAELDYQFAKMIDQKQQAYAYTPLEKNLAVLLVALISFNVMQGHTALRLDSSLANNPFGLNVKEEASLWQEILQKIEQIPPVKWPEILKDHIAFSHSPTQTAPLIFQNGLLYFYRYWQAEHNVATYLKEAVETTVANQDLATDKQILDRLFPEPTTQIDWQKIAVATALRKKFSLISGGPGTGKTTTVAKLLAALQEKQLHSTKRSLKIALVAPTGKAAARLKESITQSLAHLKLTFDIPTPVLTIHRLLVMRPLQDKPFYHKQNPLHLDLLIVDEASMIDLFMMEKLMNALKPTTRLIMLGDKDQLASVEAGAIMGELGHFMTQGYSTAHCTALNELTGYQLNMMNQVPTICDSLCHLQKSYRFDANSGIGALAKKVNQQQADESWQTFLNPQFTDLEKIEYPNKNQFTETHLWTQECVNLIVKKAVQCYQHYLTLVKQREKDPASVSVDAIFIAFQRIRFLSALRIGELGAERLNQWIAEALKKAKLINFINSRDRYLGKPILITQNSPENNIYSGDIGIILPDENGMLRAYFDTKLENTHLSVSLSRIPESEPAYIMTVHKSQGSEFEQTFLIMPLNNALVVTKELIYTAITRAKKQFTVFCNKKNWYQGIQTNIQRQSGLKEQLINIFC
ncbi:exodeoxyribonuclease V subunit alpha [[Haemophilus] ducreyi]|nr:exodeoxyribonuclease V subunit alpha [[Haemophilus] ducreyi]